jgi:plastocyanin
MKKFILFFAASLSAAIASADTLLVTVQDGMFTPQTQNVKVGDVVTWSFVADGHTTTSGTGCNADGRWNSGTKGVSETYSYTFTAAGEYPYFCTPHCANGMTGMVIVSTGGTTGVERTYEQGVANLYNFPNPFTTVTTLAFNSPTAKTGILEVFSADGKCVSNCVIYAVAGENVVPLKLNIPGGTYVAKLTLDAVLPEYRIIVRR